MPTVEGSDKTGWLVLFTADETRKIAEPVSNYGGPIAALAAFIPEPIVTNIISLGSAALTFFAKKATQEDRLLALYIHGDSPFSHLFRLWRARKPSDIARNLYTHYGSVFTAFAPFVYDEKNPQSLESWRRAVGI